MTIKSVCRALVAIVIFLFATMISNASDESQLLPGATKARTLIKEGQFDQALPILRSLVRDHPNHTQILFLIGLATIEKSRLPDTNKEDRDALLDEAVVSLRTILINRPELVRVRLELARAFFLKKEDSLARDHFERVLAGQPPAPVAINVRYFLTQIRARRRWEIYLGVSLAPDSNIGSASDAETIDIFGFPFRRDVDSPTTSGVGVSMWTGGEYQYPLGDRLRLRMGTDMARQEHKGKNFDQLFLSMHAGPRWLVDVNTDASLLASARRRWLGSTPYYDELGIRAEVRRRLNRRTTMSARASWHDREHQTQTFMDGAILSASIGGSLLLTPTIRTDLSVGYERERTLSKNWQNTDRWARADVSFALPRGFTLGAGGEIRKAGYKGFWFPFTPGGAARKDRVRSIRASIHNRAFTVYGFSPQLVVTKERRETNAQLYEYERTHGELRFVRQF